MVAYILLALGGVGLIFGDGGIDVKYTTSGGATVREESVGK